MLILRHFTALNVARCNAWHPIESWTLSDWMTALTGEVGEAANVIKKLNRVRDGVNIKQYPKNKLEKMLADELADIFIYLDLIAIRAKIDLESAVIKKFNETSKKNNLEHKIMSDGYCIYPEKDLYKQQNNA